MTLTPFPLLLIMSERVIGIGRRGASLRQGEYAHGLGRRRRWLGTMGKEGKSKG
jgi:hypothetical protein